MVVSPFRVYDGVVDLDGLVREFDHSRRMLAAAPVRLPWAAVPHLAVLAHRDGASRRPRLFSKPLTDVGDLRLLLREFTEGDALIERHLNAAMTATMLELIVECVSASQRAEPLAVAYKMLSVLGNCLIIMGADTCTEKKAMSVVMETSPFAGLDCAIKAVLVNGMPRSGARAPVSIFFCISRVHLFCIWP
eukprot:Transcript_24662.p2 GENE.Transcript_24662~~Transcript_24662.p2  ORF type:complete len:191 (+),score=63.17 Transcript_24662:336-908(+)